MNDLICHTCGSIIGDTEDYYVTLLNEHKYCSPDCVYYDLLKITRVIRQKDTK